MADTTQTTTVRYAEYLEDIHKKLVTSVVPIAFTIAGDFNPFARFTPWDLDQLYLDPAMRNPESWEEEWMKLPTLFESYRDHLLNLDVLDLYTEMIQRTLFVMPQAPQSPDFDKVIDDAVEARQEKLLHQYDVEVDPRIRVGMRDLNAVTSSYYTIARTIALSHHLLQLNDLATSLALEKPKFELQRYELDLKAFDAQLRAIALGIEAWKVLLEWHSRVPAVYGEVLKSYAAQRIDIEEHVFELTTKGCLWPFTAFNGLTGVLAALTTGNTTTSVMGEGTKRSALRGAIGGGISGVTAGSVAGPWGMLVGGAVGMIGGLLSS